MLVLHRHDVERVLRSHRQECRDLAGRLELLDELVEGSVGEEVAVIREKDLVVADVVPDGFQALADVSVDAGIGEGDLPVLDVGALELEAPAPVREGEVVRERLVVLQKVALDHVGLVA